MILKRRVEEAHVIYVGSSFGKRKTGKERKYSLGSTQDIKEREKKRKLHDNENESGKAEVV